MSFKINKPALTPPRGADLFKPVELLHSAVGMLARVVGDPLQSAVRVGELHPLGEFHLFDVAEGVVEDVADHCESAHDLLVEPRLRSEQRFGYRLPG